MTSKLLPNWRMLLGAPLEQSTLIFREKLWFLGLSVRKRIPIERKRGEISAKNIFFFRWAYNVRDVCTYLEVRTTGNLKNEHHNFPDIRQKLASVTRRKVWKCFLTEKQSDFAVLGTLHWSVSSSVRNCYICTNLFFRSCTVRGLGGRTLCFVRSDRL